jgi:hypothetical protein
MINSAREATAVALKIDIIIEVTKAVAPDEIENDYHLQERAPFVKRSIKKLVIGRPTSSFDRIFVDYRGNRS